MSDYFGALMRSGGLAAAGAQSRLDAHDRPPPALEDAAIGNQAAAAAHDPVPAVAAAPAAAPGAAAATRSATAPPVAMPPPTSVQRVRAAAVATPSPIAAPAHRSAPPAAPSSPALDGAHRGRRTSGTRIPASPDMDSPHTATPEADTSAQASASTQPSRIRAALQWIAADPHGADPGNLPERQAPPAGRSPPPDDASSLTDAPAAPHSPHAARARGDAPLPRHTAIEAWLPEPAMPAHASQRRREHDDVPGDLVEVSIGAIHVRVDSPAAQTRLAPAAPAAAPRAPSRPAARDAAARRLLRRI